MKNDFDKLPVFVQVAILLSFIVTVPIWGVPYLIHLLRDGLKEDSKRREQDEYIQKLLADRDYLRNHFRKVQGDMAKLQRKENENEIDNKRN